MLGGERAFPSSRSSAVIALARVDMHGERMDIYNISQSIRYRSSAVRMEAYSDRLCMRCAQESSQCRPHVNFLTSVIEGVGCIYFRGSPS